MKETDFTDEGQHYFKERYLEYMSMEYDEIFVVPGRTRSRHKWSMDEAWDHIISTVYIIEGWDDE